MKFTSEYVRPIHILVLKHFICNILRNGQLTKETVSLYMPNYNAKAD